MSGEVLAAAAAAAARSLDELLLSHDVIFPALFNSRLSTQFVEKHERLQRSPKAGRERGSRGAGRALGTAHLAGADKSRNLRTGLLLLLLLWLSRDHRRSSRRGGSCCRGSPLLRGGRRRLRGQPHAAASAERFPAAAAERWGRGTRAQAAETPRRAGCGGTEVTWERGRRAARAGPAAQQVPAARSGRAAPARPLRARERAKSAGALGRACAAGRRRARYLPAPRRDAAGAPGSVGKARGCVLRVLRALRTVKGKASSVHIFFPSPVLLHVTFSHTL
ncbi:uncharacterized protein LOC135295130 [Passer domesticus]|uniref:uncharacterized protein LOC135295130 n=1 Tax=Passer domesticus TaxID=48849 RepID=UPI0030FEBC27